MNRLSLDARQTARCLGFGIRFFLAAALAGCQLLGGAPFALGFLAAAGARADGLAALAGAGAGALLFMDFRTGLSFFATGILIFSTATAFEGTAVARKPWFSPAVATFLFFAVRLIYLLQSPRMADEFFPALAVTCLVGLSAWAYAQLLRADLPSAGRQGAVLFLALSLTVGLTGLLLPGGVSVGRVLAGTLVLFAAYTRGAGTGAACGVCAGLAMDLAGGSGALFFAAAYGFLGLAAGLRSQQGRLGAAGCTLCATLLLLLPVTAEEGLPLLWESLGGTLVFLLLPGRLFGGKRMQAKVRENGQASVLDRLREQLNQSAAAFRDLYDSFSRTPPTEENPAIVFDRAAERTCRGCALCDICWKREYNTTFNAMNDATPLLLERGRALAKDFPSHFTNRCIHLPDLLTSINTELSAYLLRRQYRRQLDDARRDAKGQYAQMSELLSSTAAQLEGPARPVSSAVDQMAYAVGAALRPKEGETVSGDSVTAFETSGGLLYLILSDGMGTGEAARRESAMTVRLLERFLRAGVEAEAALKTLNMALSLRSADTGSFTTIDLLRLRLRDGEAALYKYGAAPSYLKHGGRVQRITGASLPAGLHDAPAPPDATRFRLEGDSFVVMVSDGVTDAAHDEWLQNLLAGWQGDDPQALVGLILSEVKRRGALSDDCGVQILYLPETAGGKREI